MLDTTTLNKFISHANKAHQQFTVWFYFNNKFAQHQKYWNEYYPTTYFSLKDFDKTKGAKYKNFWSVTLVSTQHSWILGTSRLFDPAFSPIDKAKKKPRMSFDYIIQNLRDLTLAQTLEDELMKHEPILKSLKGHRNNSLAHNDIKFDNTRIEAGIEKLYLWLEDAIARIKTSESHLISCNRINVEYNEKLAKCGTEEVFNTLLIGEKYE